MAILTITVGFIIAVVSKLVADEVKAWLPAICHRLISIAVLRLPKKERVRFSEEWRADLAAYPGELTRLIRAAGFIWAASRIHTRKYTSINLLWVVQTTNLVLIAQITIERVLVLLEKASQGRVHLSLKPGLGLRNMWGTPLANKLYLSTGKLFWLAPKIITRDLFRWESLD